MVIEGVNSSIPLLSTDQLLSPALLGLFGVSLDHRTFPRFGHHGKQSRRAYQVQMIFVK